jgi:NADP-dependent 3-hydroxy acid dehydrogenase YdfG
MHKTDTQALIITGASSGIGFECVKQFLELGYQVIALSRNTQALEALFPQPRLDIRALDLSNSQQLQATFDGILKDYAQIHGLINNAGTSHSHELQDATFEENRQVIELNVQALTECIECVLPRMREQRFGNIINLSSLADRHPRPGNPVYAASKAYVRSLSESLRAANGSFNIRVMSLSPAIVTTPLVERLHPGVEGIEVERFVELVRFIYQMPQHICVRDLVVAPTSYPN